MATSFQKTYSVTVTFKSDLAETITDSDVNPAALREKIIQRIEEACRISRGIINIQPGTVSET